MIRVHSEHRAIVPAAVELASAEAAEDDPAFAPDVVRPAAANLFREIQRAWSAQDKQRLARLVGQDLLTEWGRRLRDFKRKGWRNEVEILEGPHVEYVGLRSRFAERWTLALDGSAEQPWRIAAAGPAAGGVSAPA